MNQKYANGFSEKKRNLEQETSELRQKIHILENSLDE